MKNVCKKKFLLSVRSANFGDLPVIIGNWSISFEKEKVQILTSFNNIYNEVKCSMIAYKHLTKQLNFLLMF